MDPFRKVFLDQVRAVIAKDARKDTLYELLKIGTPSLQQRDVLDESTRSKAFKTLQLRIHPESILVEIPQPCTKVLKRFTRLVVSA